MQVPRCLPGVAGVLQPGQQRLRQGVLLGGPQPAQRREPAVGQVRHQVFVGEQQQRGQVLIAAGHAGARADDAAPGQHQRAARPAQRTARPGQRDGRPESRRPAPEAAFDQLGPPGSVGIGHQRARTRAGHVDERIRGQRGQHAGRRPGPALAVLRQGHRGYLAGQRPPRRPGAIGDRLPGHRRVGDEQVEQPPPAALHFTTGLGARLGEALGAGGGQFVEVQEDGLTDPGEHVGVEAAAPGGQVQPAPGDTGTESQRRLERLEAASFGRLDAADVAEQLRRPFARRRGIGDLLRELMQRMADRPADCGVVGVIVRPRVLRYLPLDRADHFLGREVQFGEHELGCLSWYDGPRNRRIARSHALPHHPGSGDVSHWLPAS